MGIGASWFTRTHEGMLQVKLATDTKVRLVYTFDNEEAPAWEHTVRLPTKAVRMRRVSKGRSKYYAKADSLRNTKGDDDE